MPLGSTSGSSEENWENTESGLALADKTTAVLQGTVGSSGQVPRVSG